MEFNYWFNKGYSLSNDHTNQWKQKRTSKEIFLKYSSSFLHLFIIYSSYIHHIFIIYSSYIHHIFISSSSPAHNLSNDVKIGFQLLLNIDLHTFLYHLLTSFHHFSLNTDSNAPILGSFSSSSSPLLLIYLFICSSVHLLISSSLLHLLFISSSSPRHYLSNDVKIGFQLLLNVDLSTFLYHLSIYSSSLLLHLFFIS